LNIELLVQVGGPALFAGGVAVGVTVAIERWGGVVGGMLGTLPTTIVPFAVGIHLLAPDLGAFRDALCATPAGMLVNALFLYLWRWVPPRLPAGSLRGRLTLTLALTGVAWVLGAAALTAGMAGVRRAGWPLLPVAVGLLVGAVLVGGLACWRRPPAPRGSRPAGATVLAARGLLAAGAIALAVLLARLDVPLLAGMAAVFPAIYLTTMVSLWLAQGEAVPAGAVGPMMLGSASVSTFALLATWSVPALGVAAGCALAWVGAALAVTAPATWWLRRGEARRAALRASA